jgi:hypothetical protein
MEIVARYKNCLFQRFCPFVTLVILYDNRQLLYNDTWEDYKHKWDVNQVPGGNVKVTANTGA